MATSPCHQLNQAGTAVWLDQLSRELIQAGKLRDLMASAALTGVTSNPAIFHTAMTKGDAYDAQLIECGARGLTNEQAYEELAVRDIQMACDALRPVWDGTQGRDGYVSLEVSPHLARDTDGTVAAAKRLHAWVDRKNVLIKIPGTTEGVPAIERCLAAGIPINVTLLFSLEAYEAVARCYVRAMKERASAGLHLQVASVASFFVSRIDSLTDKVIEEASKKAEGAAKDSILALRGQAAVLNARLAYASYKKIFSGPDWEALRAKGAWVQRPLWASTSTKNPVYPDVLYVDTLVGRDTVNTMPFETLLAFQDHGTVKAQTVEHDLDGARAHFAKLEALGISFRSITDQLLVEAIEKFNEPYDKLLTSLGNKLGSLRPAR